MNRKQRRAIAGDCKVTVAWLHPGEVTANFHHSMTDLVLYDLAHHRRIMGHSHGEMAKECGSGGIVDGRNKIAAAVLDSTDSDWLMWFDADMGFGPETVDALIEVADPVERPVVGGLCFAAQTDGESPFYGRRYRAVPTLYVFHELEDKVGFVPLFNYPPDSVVQVSGTGSACILIHRSVLAAVRERFGDEWYTPIVHPRGPTTFSEDLSFCVRAAACDVPIHVHTGVRTNHHKGYVFLDEDYYLAQEMLAGRRPATTEEASCPQPASA